MLKFDCKCIFNNWIKYYYLCYKTYLKQHCPEKVTVKSLKVNIYIYHNICK